MAFCDINSLGGAVRSTKCHSGFVIIIIILYYARWQHIHIVYSNIRRYMNYKISINLKKMTSDTMQNEKSARRDANTARWP